jgi:hypothetical protein
MRREDSLDELSSLSRQCDANEALVLFRPLADHESPLFKPFHDRCRAPTRPQQLQGEIALAQRPEVEESLQRAELAAGQPLSRQALVQSGRDRFRGPDQGDERIQRPDLLVVPAVACRHTLISK